MNKKLDLKTLIYSTLIGREMTKPQIHAEIVKIIPSATESQVEIAVGKLGKTCLQNRRELNGCRKYSVLWMIGNPELSEVIGKKQSAGEYQDRPTLLGGRIVHAGDQIRKNHPHYRPELRKVTPCGIGSSLSMMEMSA